MAGDMKTQKAMTAGFRDQESGIRKGRAIRGNRFCLLIAAFCLLPFSPAIAETLRDPTRPPDVLYAPDDGAGIEAGPVLQSVLISPGRRTAVISGQSVKTGDRFGDGRVVRISETEVVLKTGSGLQTLKLFPDVEKRTAVKTRRPRR